MFLKLLVVSLLAFSLVAYPVFDPADEKYCSLSCSGAQNVACRCPPTTNCVRLTRTKKDFKTFRMRMLNFHNSFRSKIASGEESLAYNLPSASNMNFLRYDLSLEYGATCSALACHKEEVDSCVATSAFRTGVVQNIHVDKVAMPPELLHHYEHIIKLWYAEISLFRRPSLDSFEPNNRSDRFSAMTWATITHLGCAIAVFPEKGPKTVVKIVCNYAGKGIQPNKVGSSVYLPGKGCSKCPKNVECNDIYLALCGETTPIPQDVAPGTLTAIAPRITTTYLVVGLVFSLTVTL